MTTKIRIAAAALFVALSAQALAADPAQSAMAGDPNWPAVAEVAPSIALSRAPAARAATEVDPTTPAPSTSSQLALRQEPLVDDPLQGFADASIRYAAASAPKSQPAVACSCPCQHG